MQDNTTQELASASPESIFQAQEKPSDKAIEALEEWRDKETSDEWAQEALNAAIEWLENEVKQ